MNLVVHIPHRITEEESGALSLAQRAPTFTIEWDNGERVGTAVFPSLPQGIDLALQLIGEAVRLEGAWASMNARPISSLTKLWQRLECYRESLSAEDPFQHCLKKSVLFNTLVGCEEHLCPVPCQFVCTPCMKMSQEAGAIISLDQRFKVAATLAEIEWCPRLNFPGRQTGGHPLLPSSLAPLKP